MPGTLYITDLDGTLLAEDDRIPTVSLRLLNALLDEGLPLTYATARSLSSARTVTNGLRVRLPVIVYNGAFIRDAQTGQDLYSAAFSAGQRSEIEALSRRFSLFPLVYAFIDGRERVSWLTGRENEGIARYLSLRKGDPRLRPVNDLRALFAGEAFYYTFIGSNESLEPLHRALSGLTGYTCILQQELYRPEFWCEVMPLQATKAVAARKNKALLGFERIVAFGDAVNDIPLFEAADEAYAVQNAAPQLRAVAHGMIGSNDENGVALFLRDHFACRRPSK